MKILLLRPDEVVYFRWLDPFGYLNRLAIPGCFAMVGALSRNNGYDEPAALMVCTLEKERLVLEWLCVAPERRGYGIGSAMLTWLFRKAEKLKLPEVAVRMLDDDETGPSAEGAESFFRIYFPGERHLRGVWKINAAEFVDHPMIMQGREMFPDAVRLKDLPRTEILKVLRVMEASNETSGLKDVLRFLRNYDKELSSVLYDGKEPCGILLCVRAGMDCVPVFFYAESVREAFSLLVAGLGDADELLGEQGRILMIDDRQITSDVMSRLFPYQRIPVKLLTALPGDL